MLDMMNRLGITRPGDAKYLTSTGWDSNKVIDMLQQIRQALQKQLDSKLLTPRQIDEYIQSIAELLPLILAPI